MIALRAIQPKTKKEQVTPTKESLLQILKEFNYSTIDEILLHTEFEKAALKNLVIELANQGEIILIGNRIFNITTRHAVGMALLLFTFTAILPTLF
ncbi:hypothetical protein P9B97_02305 [Bacillus paralicheniformis]|uniref:hypothetical protein n=1 Tax=Bacillus paralicheniformis TaxID=1648923 RepID=UPI002DB6CD96|nr:hypothetical protein [Bacillus paralicheniformis]MEC1050914.1 hypothetical protein [Bacillus paralicheniformis]MEC1085054.1 hypothetical protein [Bacillus paralicheniformis]MEC1108854.1 hypothetical protein [Bacillus paralicheniformis]MEC1137168.1 hypothetical protein [Bacillus paralicheniformis]MEC1148077.1 hypothetical protein [Bacillus paralicheniformis]